MNSEVQVFLTLVAGESIQGELDGAELVRNVHIFHAHGWLG